ncbi:MAG: DUF6785 family protein [Capsulimonadales bacterium]|nr:DUF6785 family protein [Capsulimonadales bacterium]
MNRPSPSPEGVTGRAILLGAVLVPVLVAWAEYVEIKAAGPDMISTSIILCVMFAVLVISGVNSLLHRFAPRFALRPGEILTLYAMGGVGVSPCGIGMLQWLVPALPARGTGRWKDSDYLVPAWARVTDPEAVKAFYRGGADWQSHLHAWAVPIAFWTALLLALFGAMFCLSVLLRRQWIERERLLFPLVQFPLEVLGGTSGVGGGPIPLGKNPWFLIGIAVPVVLQGLAALHYTFLPALPFFPIKPNDMPEVQGWFVGRPWSGVGYLRLTFYPFVIGLAFLLSVEVSFSCWFSYWLIKLLSVLTFALGWNDGDGADLWNTKTPPLFGDQSVGGFLGLALLSLFLARRHLAGTWRTAIGEAGGSDDRDEAIGYRTAWIGLGVCFSALVISGVVLGVPPLAAFAFFLCFLLLVIGFARIRAEAGVPWGYGPPMNLNGFTVEAVGTAHWPREALGSFSLLLWMDNDYRSTQMPYQTEAWKIADAAGLHARRLAVALLVALIVGLIAGWVSQLYLYYAFGGDNGLQRTAQGAKFPTLLNHWLSNTRPTAWHRIGAVGFGMTAVWGLAALRTAFAGWSLHPIGYVVACTWTMQWLWLPMLIGWLAKTVVLRYGGMRGYRAALPFFFGLILGDYAVSGGLALFYTLFDVPGYRTFPI